MSSRDNTYTNKDNRTLFLKEVTYGTYRTIRH